MSRFQPFNRIECFVLVLGLIFPGPMALAHARAAGDAVVKPERDEVEQALLVAQTAPPAFAAHLLLAIVEANAIRDRTRRLMVIEQAVELGLQSEHATHLVTPVGASLETRMAIITGGLELPFDRLSLACRAVQCLVETHPRRARDIFARMPTDQWIEAPRCHVEAVASPRIYFETARILAERGFSAKERRDGLDAFLIEQTVGSVARPEQMPDAARLILQAEAREDTRLRWAEAFRGALARIEADGLAMEFVLAHEENREALYDLGRVFPEPDRKRYFGSLAGLLERSLGSERCETSLFDDVPAEIAESFTRRSGGVELKPSALRATSAARQDHTSEHLFRGAHSERALRGLQTLRYEYREIKERAAPAALVAFADRYFAYVDTVAAWNSTESRSIEDAVVEQTIVAIMLMEIAPTDAAAFDAGKRALDALVSTNPREFPAAMWWNQARALTARAPTAIKGRLAEYLANLADARMRVFLLVADDANWRP